MQTENTLATDLQNAVVAILSAGLPDLSVTVLAENRRDIAYAVENALGSQGLVATVLTPTLVYLGVEDGKDLTWEIPELIVQAVEYVPVNRAPERLSAVTALDYVQKAVDVLASPLGSYFGQFCPVRVEQSEEEGLLIAKATLKTYASTDLSAFPSPVDPRQRITFVTHPELSTILTAYAPLSAIPEAPSLSNYYTKAEVDARDTQLSVDLQARIPTTTYTLSVENFDGTLSALEVYVR